MNRLLMFAFVAVVSVTSLGCGMFRGRGCFDRDDEVMYQPNPCCCQGGVYEGAVVVPGATTVPTIPSTVPVLPGPAGVN